MPGVTSSESSLPDDLTAKFERFGTTSVLNQLKTDVVLVLWAKAAAAHGCPLPAGGNTHGAGAARVSSGRHVPPSSAVDPNRNPSSAVDQPASTQRTKAIARDVANTLVWGPLRVLCRHPLRALQHATR